MGLLFVYNVAWAEAYLSTKLYLDPSSRFATTDTVPLWGWRSNI